MRRLTERDGKTGYAYFPRCFEGCDGYCGKCEHEADYVETLAAYEDTGHTPEQIGEFDALYLAKCQEVNELRKRMQWIPVEEQRPDNGTAFLATVLHRKWICDYDRDESEWNIHPEHMEVCMVYRDGDEYIKMDDTDYSCTTYIPVDKQDENIEYPVEEVIAWMPLPEPYRPEAAHNEPAWKQQMMNTFLGGRGE